MNQAIPCPRCGFPSNGTEMQCSRCGAFRFASDSGMGANPNAYAAPDPRYQGQPMPMVAQGDATGGVIPYKNPCALIAYYLGLFSLLPLIGFPIGLVAFVLGIMGLLAKKRNPEVKGSVHAAIGIGCGGICALAWGVLIVGMIIAATSQ